MKLAKELAVRRVLRGATGTERAVRCRGPWSFNTDRSSQVARSEPYSRNGHKTRIQVFDFQLSCSDKKRIRVSPPEYVGACRSVFRTLDSPFILSLSRSLVGFGNTKVQDSNGQVDDNHQAHRRLTYLMASISRTFLTF